MARVTKPCPTCGPKAPVELEVKPDGQTDLVSAVQGVVWTATCKTCGYVHPADTDEKVIDAGSWAKQKRAENNGEIVLE